MYCLLHFRCLICIHTVFCSLYTIFYPCLCLCRGFVQITHKRPRRFSLWQWRQIFLTDALTFMLEILSEFRAYLPDCRRGSSYTQHLSPLLCCWWSIIPLFQRLYNVCSEREKVLGKVCQPRNERTECAHFVGQALMTS